jgi:hypothetical protein
MNLPSDQIWKASAVASAKQQLLLTYAWLVLTSATALFSLIEANSPTAKTPRPPKRVANIT